MSEPTTQTERLRELQNDMQEMYDAAKTIANAALMERLAKSIASLMKQIKEQEVHDNEVIKRLRAISFGALIGTEFANMAKVEFGEKVIPILEDLALQIELIAEAELS